MFNYSFDITPRDWGNTVATVDLIIDDVTTIRNFRILSGSNGLWVAPPQEQALTWTTENGERIARPKLDDQGKPIFYPIISWPGDRAEGEKQTATQAEVYAEMLKAYEAQAAQSTRQGAAKQQANRNGGGGRSKLWGPQNG